MYDDDDEEENAFWDQMIKDGTHNGVNISTANMAKSVSPVGGSWCNTTMSEYDYKLIKERVSMLITEHLVHKFASDDTHSSNRGLHISLKRTDDIAYGVRFYFQGTGNFNEIDLIFQNLASTIQVQLPDDVSSAYVSRQFTNCIVVCFHKPVYLEFISFVIKMVFYLWLMSVVWYGAGLLKGVSDQYTKEVLKVE